MKKYIRILSACILIAVFAGISVFRPLAQILPDEFVRNNPPGPKLPNSWSILASYTIPGKASGLAWDGTYIYFGEYWTNGDKVYKFDPSNGTYTLQCTGPFDEAYGLTYVSPNLATIKQPSSSSQPSQIMIFSMSGTQVGTITLPDHYMSGVAYDAGDYWVCTYYPDPGLVYHVNSSGTVLSSFVPPNNQPWDICMQGSDLWIADYYANMLYKVTTSGTLLESHASQGIKPSGIVYDGTYLWYCDGELGQNSTLYKVDLNGSGTPVIYVPVTSHDYGIVTIGTSSTWNCEVQNTGTANLIIDSIGIPQGAPVTTTFVTPATLAPNQTTFIPLTYQPTTAGPLNDTVVIYSNDPIHPEVDLTLTGNAVYQGPHINIETASHDWNERRKNAYSRWYLNILNDGNQVLLITALNMSDPRFTIDPSVTLPLSIPTLQTKSVGIWFHPDGAGQFQGTLNIVSNDASQNPFQVALSGKGIDILYPMGATLWSWQLPPSTFTNVRAIRPVQDITGDNVDDVIIASEDDYVRCFNGNASVEADVMWETSIYAGYVYQENALAVIDDIDGDGYKDVIIGTAGGDRSITALSGKTGLQLWKHDTHEYGGGGWVYQVDTKYDYNDDGFPDVLASVGDDGSGTGPRRVYCLNGKTGATIWSRPTGGAAFSVIGVEDFTYDGIPDVVAGATNSGQSIGYVYGIDGSNGTVRWTSPATGSSVWALIQVDDFTGDGIKDVVSGDFSGHITYHNAVTGAGTYFINVGSDIILRFGDMGDVNGDGHPDFLVAHSGPQAVMANGHEGAILWQKPISDQSWTVTNMGDINWDGINDAGIGTLYNNNQAYFMNGVNGHVLASVPYPSAIDAVGSIPDIVGDSSRELIVGGRDGEIYCLSGGYDSSTVAVREIKDRSLSAKIFPNPCRDEFRVGADLPSASEVIITLTDIAGRLLGRHVFPVQPAGYHEFVLERDRAGFMSGQAGMGILKIETAGGSWHGKIIFE